MTSKIRLAGIDLAWQSDKNPTAIAIGALDSDCLVIEAIVVIPPKNNRSFQ